MEIAGKTVLITGGSAGVWLAAARRFLQFGARVAKATYRMVLKN